MIRKNSTPNSRIINMCQKLHIRGLTSAYGGNISIRVGKNKIIITPRGSSLSELNEDDLVVIDTEGKILFGTNKPSSEMDLHLEVYRRRPDINGIIHTHPVAVTAFTYVSHTIFPVNPRAFEYLHDIPIVPYDPKDMNKAINMVGDKILDNDIIMLEMRGMISVGESLSKAYNLAELVEENALTNLYVRILEISSNNS